MKNATSLSLEEITINYTETDPAKKFPELVGSTKKLILQKDDEIYYAIIKYSYTAKWLVLEIQDSNQNTLQNNTYIASSPINLISCAELIGYGLFFKVNKLLFVKLDTDYYSMKYTDTQLIEDFNNEVF